MILRNINVRYNVFVRKIGRRIYKVRKYHLLCEYMSKGATSVKILPIQVEKIQEIVEDKDLRYRSKNDFVVKAVDNELRLATLKHGMSPGGKMHFELLYNESLYKVYERAKQFDTGGMTSTTKV
jgi:hypothetical protein